MTINKVIRERRKELGLTQERVADYLGISAPAVNKWEKGAACPDISLLPALARLLEIDLNTLFCFNEGLTILEISHFCGEVMETIQKEGLESGFTKVNAKVREYPNCGRLIHNCALVLEGVWLIDEKCMEEKEKYEEKIISLYERAAECGDEEVRAEASFMLASKYMNSEAYEKAQTLLDSLPEQRGPDKRMLQAGLMIRQTKYNEAAEILEWSLLKRINDMQTIFMQLADIAVKEGNLEQVVRLGKIWETIASQTGLWEYNALVISLEAGIASKSVSETLSILKSMLASAVKSWGTIDSPLFSHLPHQEKREGQESFGRKLLPVLLSDLESNPKYEFLRSDGEFKHLIRQYRSFAEQGNKKG